MFKNKVVVVFTTILLSVFSSFYGMAQTAPVFTTTSIDEGEFNSAYTFNLITTDAESQDRDLVISSGTLPTGLIFTDNNDGSATISGTPSETGTFDFDVTVTETVTPFDATVQSFSLIINKAVAIVTLQDLIQTYDGSPKLVTATTSPTITGTVEFTYDGSASAPTNAGSYAVVGTIVDDNYQGTASGTLQVNKASSVVTLQDLIQTYDGSPKPVTATTSPTITGTVEFTYDGSASAPTNAGSYAVIGTIVDDNYQGTASGTLQINKALSVVTLQDLIQTYDGSPKPVTATTSPTITGAVEFTYDGSVSAPTNAGSYVVVGTIVDDNYQGTASGTLQVNKASSVVTLQDLIQTYDGSPKPVTATTSPTITGTVEFTYDGSASTPTNAGSYAVIGTIVDDNYQGTASGTLQVNKASSVVTLQDLIQTYDGSPKPVTATTSPTITGTVEFTYDGSASTPTNAGSYAVIGTIVDDNYQGTASGTLQVNKASSVVTLQDLIQTYDGSPKPVTATTSPTITGTVEFTYDGSASAPTNAGSYAVIGTIVDDNYQGTASGTLTIEKATAIVTLGSLIQTYDGNSKAAIASTSPSGLSVEFTYNGLATEPINAGNYAVVGTINDTNYEGSASGTLTINKAPASVVIGSLTQTYNGSGKSVTVTTVPSGLSVDVTYDGLVALPINAGSYNVVATINDQNYQGTATNSLVINKASATVILSNLNQTYDGAPKQINTSTTPSGLTVDVTYNGSPTAPIDAGSYAISAAVDDTNYEGNATGTLTVDKAIATINLADLNQVYDGTGKPASATTTPPGLTVDFTYDGLAAIPVNAGSYNVEATINETNFQGSTTGTLEIEKAVAAVTLTNLTQTYSGTSRVVSASTMPSGLTVDITYDGLITPPVNAGTYTVVGQINDANYQGSSSQALIVNKALLDVRADNISRPYGISNPPLTLTYSGFVSGDSRFNLSQQPSANTAATNSSNVGVYAITVGGGVDENYDFQYTNGTLTISKATVTARAINQTRVYGSPNPVLGISYSGFANGENESVLDVLPSIATVATQFSDVNTYPITVSGGSDGNYNINYQSGTLTITKATLFVRAEDKTRVFGISNPIFTLAYTGFLDDDGISDIDTPPLATTLATTSSNVGTYPITLSGGSDNNYNLSLTNGSLIITKATATVNVQNATFTYDGFAKTSTITTNPAGLIVTTTYNGSSTAPINANSYSVVSTIDELNYEGSGTGVLTINKATPIIAISNLYQNFDGSPKSVNVTTTPSGLANTVTYNGSASPPTAVGTYTINVTVNTTNYIGNAANTLIINGAPTTSGIDDLVRDEDANNDFINLFDRFDDLEDTDAELDFAVIQFTNATLFSSVTISNGLLLIDYAPDQFGSSTITVRATDNGGLFVNESFDVTVNPVQDDPFFTSTPITGAIQGQSYSYSITTDDPDPTDTHTITNAIVLPTWLSLIDNGDGTAVLSGVPGSADAGQTFGIALQVQDNAGNSVNQFFNITVTNSNDTPTFTSTPITNATEDVEYVYFISTNDPDNGDVLSLSSPTLPSWLILTDNGDGTGKIEGTPDNTHIGNNPVTLRVTDNSGAFSQQSFNINVSNSNDPPFFTSTPVTTVNEDQLYTYNIAADDSDTGDILELRALSKPSWLTLVDNGDGTGVLSGTPNNSHVGSVSIVINVRDEAGANINQNFNINVVNTNDDPQFTSIPITVALQDAPYIYNISTSDVDANDTRSITGVTIPSWLNLQDNGNGTASLTGTPSNTNLGSHPVQLRVTDSQGGIDNQSFTVVVDNANDPPTFTSTPITSATEDLQYTYNITTADPDANDTRSIIALAKPNWLSLNDNGNGTAQLTGLPLNANVGTFSIVLQVEDAIGETANQNFTVTVANTNDAPIFLSTPITTGLQGVNYTYNVVTDDPDAGDQSSLFATTLPSWLTFTNNGDGTGTISGIPTNSNLGANVVRLEARDQNNAETPQVFTITVNNTNDAPFFTSTPILEVNEDDFYSYSITADDPDNGDVLEIRSLVLPDWLVLVDNGDGSGTLSGTPENDDVGQADVVLQIEDAQEASVNQNFTIQVNNTNDAPLFVSNPVTGAIQDFLYEYNITTADPDFNDTRAITVITKPNWLNFVDNGNGTGRLTGSPTNSDLGSNPVSLQVTDNEGASTQQNFVINVDNANDPPSFTSTPILAVNEDDFYQYNITTSDPDVGDTRDIIALSKPDWLTLVDNEDGTAILSGTPSNDNVGNFSIVLNVNDAVGANVNQNFTVTVRNTNDPPFFTSSPTPIAVQNLEYNYSITTSDVDLNDTRILDAITIPSWLSFSGGQNGNGLLSGTPTNADLGLHDVVLNVEDASGAAVEQRFQINVDNANDPPFFTSNPLLEVDEDDEYVYNVNTGDPDTGDIRTITALSKPGWLELEDNGDGTATLSGIPLNGDVGSSNVVLNVEDGLGSNVNQSFTITVHNTNDAPSFTSVPITGAIQDAQYTYTIETSDPDIGDTRNLSVIELPSWLNFTNSGGGSGVISGTPTNSNLGPNSVSISVSDQAGALVTQSFVINVDNQNDPPAFTSTPITTIQEDNEYVYNISTADPDIGDTRLIDALSLPSWLQLVDNGDGTANLQGTPDNSNVGSSAVVLEVRDALGLSVNQNFSVQVINVNDAPFFSSTAITSAQQDQEYVYDIVTGDPDVGDSRTITSGSLPAFLSFTDNGNGTGRLIGTPQNGDFGTYDIILTVEDAAGAAAQQLFDLVVDDTNDPPFFVSSPVITVNEDELYQYDIETSDPDGLADLSILALSKPAWLTLVDNGSGRAVLSGTPQNGNVGDNPVVLNVIDGAGLNVNQNFTIEVVNVNDPPIITSNPPLTAQQDLQYSYTVTTVDPDVNDIIEITSVNALPSWLTLDDNGDGTAQLFGTPTNLDLGSYDLTIRVEDVAGITDQQSFTIVVDNLNDAPQFTSTPVEQVDEDSSYNYSITAEDPDVGDELTIFIIERPQWLTFVDNGDGTAELSGNPTNSEVGTYEIKLRVTDVGGFIGQQDFELEVINTNDLPTIVSSPVTSVNEDAIYSYNIQASDIDVGDNIVISSSTLPDWLSLTDNGDKTALLTGTPENDDVGQVSVTIIADDQQGEGQIEQTFIITVINTNDAPEFTSSPILVTNEAELYVYQISFEDVDVGDEVQISGAVLPNWLSLEEVTANSAKLVGTPDDADIGINQVELQLEDLAAAQTLQIFNIEVINVNEAPVIVSTPQTKVVEGRNYVYEIQSEDPDADDVLTYSILSIPSYLNFTDNGDGSALISGVVGNIESENLVSIRVTDNAGLTDEQTYNLTRNTPPVIADIERTINEDEVYNIKSDFNEGYSDNEGDVLSRIIIERIPNHGILFFENTALENNAEIEVENNEVINFNYIPDADYFGEDEFIWNAQDGQSFADNPATFSFEILPVNDPPNLSNLENTNLDYSLGDPPTNLTDEIIISDIDNINLFAAEAIIAENFSIGDVLRIDEENYAIDDEIFTVQYDATIGELTISGKAPRSEYETILRNVMFNSPVTSEATLSDKRIEIAVYDSLNKSNVAERIVTITEIFPELDIVNAFTPNGDGINDTWDFINLQFYRFVDLRIYEKGGREVFRCNTNTCTWDGNSNEGKEMPAGVYTYILYLNDGKRKYSGTITLIR